MELWPERIVHSPDGREWRVHVDRYRMPPSRQADDLDLDESMRDSVARRIPFFVPVLKLVELVLAPVWGATLGRRPWIHASCENPPVTMVWRATGRKDVEVAIDEIASALERGEERPVPMSARWVGYDRGWFKLRRKL